MSLIGNAFGGQSRLIPKVRTRSHALLPVRDKENHALLPVQYQKPRSVTSSWDSSGMLMEISWIKLVFICRRRRHF
ncbi:unnamed protein product [Nesidiocoris tenuis]|uniref:Uncharacterized protein n=1 Tax=Nesidiocoris tenuis TaxID=355587 RepID=A0A6H5G1B1_9HEMI|nr:unnamed protein product [Nesidiocoris tenuis]